MLRTKSMRPLFYTAVPAYANDSRLHSQEARERMFRYQIGTIDGVWTNFLPPIQGGNFRTQTDQIETSIDDDGAEASSSGDSTPLGSPMFEVAERSINLRRRRSKSVADLHEVSSLSSMSSMESLELPPLKEVSRLDAYTQREIDLDLAKYPALDHATQNNIVQRYRALNDQIRAEGLYKCNYTSYLIETVRYLLLFGMFLLCLRYGWYGTSGLFLGFLWHQLVFTAHDAGHMGITHSFTIDSIIGIVIADFMGGLSLGWWKRNHNVHHVVTNRPEHDPDIEHMPFFAISHRFFDSLQSTYYERIMKYDPFARFAIKYQQYLYYPILTLGRFNLYRLSWEYLLLGLGPKKGPAWWHRWLELAGHVFFWTWFGYGVVYRSIPTTSGRVLFIMISHMITAPLHVQITLSHFAMSTADLGVHESFPQKMLRTTMDVECPEWLDFFHGGLQFQAVHHLYPRIPRHNLRRTQKLVQDFCQDAEIPFTLYGFVDSNKEVIGRLAEVGRQAAILAQCQSSLTEKESDFQH